MRTNAIITLVLLAAPVSSELLISEVLYDAPTPESKNEWIEIYNSAPEKILLSGLIRG